MCAITHDVRHHSKRTLGTHARPATPHAAVAGSAWWLRVRRSSTTPEQASRRVISELQAIAPEHRRAAGLEGDPGGCRDPSLQLPAVAELRDAAGSGPEVARIGAHLRHGLPSPERQPHVTTIEGLGHIAAVRNVELDDSEAAVAPNPKPAEGQPSHDPARRPNH